MDETYYAIYDKENDVYMERTDWGDGEVDEDSYSNPKCVVNFENQEDAEKARKEYSNADELIVVRVNVIYEIEELN